MRGIPRSVHTSVHTKRKHEKNWAKIRTCVHFFYVHISSAVTGCTNDTYLGIQ